MIRISDITDRVQSYNPSSDIDIIQRAYVFSAKVHKGQVRLSGEPYLNHPLEVSGILTEFRLDEVTIAVGLLHDTIEDTLATEEEIRSLFGEEVLFLVNGVTKISQISFSSHEEKQAENFRKMILAMAKDIRVILIKLGDRLHNMRTLKYLPKEKQIRIAQETMEIYAPFANRLGIARMKSELEDLALKYLKPDIYNELMKKISNRVKQHRKIIDEAIQIIQAKLKEYHIEGVVTGALFSNYQRDRVEKICDTLGLKIFSPLWHMDQEKEMRQLVDEGFEFVMSSIAAEGIDKSWLGKTIGHKEINKLVKLHEKIGFHIAGEGGEFESLVLDCPLFKKALEIEDSKIHWDGVRGEMEIKKVKLVKK